MVHQIELLNKYYNIDLEEYTDFFVYDNNKFYLSNNLNVDYINYQKYLNILNKNGFILVKNKYHKIISEGYILYRAQDEDYLLNDIIMCGLQPTSNISKQDLKNALIELIDKKHDYPLYTKDYYNVIYNYYRYLGENSIKVLNMINLDRIPVGYEHLHFIDSYQILFNPDNYILTSRLFDLISAYKNNVICIQQIKSIINNNYIPRNELVLLLVLMLFNYDLFIINSLNEEYIYETYQNLYLYHNNLSNIYQLLLEFVDLPIIEWL